MANFSFTAQGATPQQPSVFGPTSGSTTPVAKALSNAQNFSIASAGNPTGKSYVSGGQFPTQPAQMTTGLMPPQNSQVTSHTTTDAAGYTTKQPYAPANTQYNASTGGTPGLINPAQNQALVTPGGGIAAGSQPPTFQGLLGTVAGQGTQQSPVAQQAQSTAQTSANEYQRLNKQIGDTRLAEAGALEHQGLAPIPMGDITGRQAVIRQQYESRLAGLGAQAQGATNLYGPSVGAATTGTGQQYSAAQSALGAAQPQVVAPGQAVFNPATGQYSSASSGGGNPSMAPSGIDQTSWDNYVQMAANGQISAIPSSITSNANLSGQLNAAAKARNPNYSPITSAAQGSSSADLTGQASSIQAQANGAEQNFNLMLDIAQKGGVNDVNVPILNTLQNNVNRGLTSSEAVTSFQSLIQSVRSQYAAILGGGTVTVEALQEAQTLVPNDISISALQSLGQNLKSDAQNRVAGITQQIQSLGQGQTSPQAAPQLGNGMNSSLTWDTI